MIRVRRVLSAVSATLRVFSLSFLVPVVVALVYEPHDVPLVAGLQVPGTVAAFLAGFIVTTLVWVPLRLATRAAQSEELLDREGYLAVGLGWIAAAVLAGLPFMVSGELPLPIDAFFEAMSGLTGTASTSLVGLSDVPASVLVWRAMLPWMGGLTIIVLLAAFLSKLTYGGMPALQGQGLAGAPRLRPKLAETARSLWTMYALASLAIAAMLAAALYGRAGLAPREAVLQGIVQAMTSYSLGGISDPAGPMPGAGDPVVDALVVGAMLLGGTNFALAFTVLRRGAIGNLLRNAEWRFYLGSFAASAALVALLLALAGHDPVGALHGALYTVASMITGTGGYILDYAAWPASALFVLLLLMLLGASSGSPSGGIKAFRWLTLSGLVLRELRKLLHPKAVIPVRVGPAVVKEETVAAFMAFFFTYLVLWTAGTIVLLAIQPGLDATDSAAAAASALGNVGGGFGSLGPTHGFGDLLPGSKVLLAALMWFGRLEIFTALLLLHPLSWKT